MASTREETLDGNHAAFGNRCMKLCGSLCIIVATLFFFGNISLIVWLFEYHYPVKFSVICFMAASGVLYLTSFTSSLLLITKGFPNKKRSMINPSEESMAGFTQREGIRESYEMTTNISYREDPNLLQLPQQVVVRKTPPPPYDSTNGLTTRDHSISENEMGVSRLTIQTLDDDGLTTNRVYYDLEGNNVHTNREMRVPPRLINDNAAVQAQTSPKLMASLDKSPTSSNEIKQQRASNSQFLLQAQEQAKKDASQSSLREDKHVFLQASINPPENSPRPAIRVKRNPSTALKRKLNTRMSMSQSDLGSDTRTGTSPSKSNAEMHSNSNLDGSSQVSQSNWNAQVRASHSNLIPEMTPKFSRRSAEVRTSNSKPAVIPRTSQSSLNIDKTLPNSTPKSKETESISNLNIGRQQFISKSNWLLPTDRRFTSYSNLNMNASQQCLAWQSNSNSDAPHSRMCTTSNISLGNSRSNIPDVVTNSQVKNLKKIYQPEQFVARSKDVPSLHKARSFGSLTVNASKSPGTGELQTVDEVNASANNYNSYVTGRSIESGLDASKTTKPMMPQEWMSAWNHGLHKLRSTDVERIVGVRL